MATYENASECVAPKEEASASDLLEVTVRPKLDANVLPRGMSNNDLITLSPFVLMLLIDSAWTCSREQAYAEVVRLHDQSSSSTSYGIAQRRAYKAVLVLMQKQI